MTLHQIETRGENLTDLAHKLNGNGRKIVVYFDGVGKPLKDIGKTDTIKIFNFLMKQKAFKSINSENSIKIHLIFFSH